MCEFDPISSLLLDTYVYRQMIPATRTRIGSPALRSLFALSVREVHLMRRDIRCDLVGLLDVVAHTVEGFCAGVLLIMVCSL